MYSCLLYCTVLYCTALHCTVFNCRVLHRTAAYCSLLYLSANNITVFYCVHVDGSAPYCTVTVIYCIHVDGSAPYWTVTVIYCTLVHCAYLLAPVLIMSAICYTYPYCILCTVGNYTLCMSTLHCQLSTLFTVRCATFPPLTISVVHLSLLQLMLRGAQGSPAKLDTRVLSATVNACSKAGEHSVVVKLFEELPTLSSYRYAHRYSTPTKYLF